MPPPAAYKMSVRISAILFILGFVFCRTAECKNRTKTGSVFLYGGFSAGEAAKGFCSFIFAKAKKQNICGEECRFESVVGGVAASYGLCQTCELVAVLGGFGNNLRQRFGRGFLCDGVVHQYNIHTVFAESAERV